MPRPRPPEQLDIPLVWEHEPLAERAPRPSGATTSRPAHAPCGFGRMLLAAITDLGALLATLAVPFAVSLVAGVSANPMQAILTAAAGLLAAAAIWVGCLWGWRGTPGQLLLKSCASQPLTLGRAAALWLAWTAALPAFGVPLLIGRSGRRLVERVAGSPFSCR
ncbi:MAG: hypothetical protein ACOY3Y_09785 [Acidobacteriota bacterium]